MNLPIKIKKSVLSPVASQPAAPAPPKRSRMVKSWVWWLLAAILAEALTLGYFLVWPPDCSPYENLLPQEVAGVFYFKHPALTSLAENLTTQNYAWPPLVWAHEKAVSLLSKAPPGLAEQIAEYFQDDAVMVILPGDAVPPNWLVLARQRVGEGKITAALTELKNDLKQDFNILEETYRYLTIIQIKPLNQENDGYFLVLAQQYFLLSNQRDLIKSTLDKIIE